MRQAARAIIIENGKLLVMHRNKYGDQYFTLVGGRVNDGETIDQALVREVMEETSLQVTSARLVFVEKHPEPYNEQYIYLCEIAPHKEVRIQDGSEEAFMNRLDSNLHMPLWVATKRFAAMPFRTPQLQQAIVDGLQHGFPAEPVYL